MRKWYFTLPLLLAAILVSAQVIDQKAKTLLEQVKTKYTDYKTLQVGFKMTLNDKASDIKDVNEGTIYLKGKKFKLDLGDNVLISNGIDLWIHIKSANQVQIMKYDENLLEEEFGFSPNTIFTIEKDDFDYRISGEKSVNDKNCTEIELSPKDKEKFYYKVKLFIENNNTEVRRAQFFEKGGIEYEFDILNQKPNAELSDAFFTFDKSKYGKDLEVEDLRD